MSPWLALVVGDSDVDTATPEIGREGESTSHEFRESMTATSPAVGIYWDRSDTLHVII